MTSSQHVYEVRRRKDKRGVALISDVFSFGRLWHGELDAASNAIGYAKFFSRSHDAVIRVYDGRRCSRCRTAKKQNRRNRKRCPYHFAGSLSFSHCCAETKRGTMRRVKLKDWNEDDDG
jgi:hypothetical protein